MMRLPRELAPWAPFLDIFPDEAVRSIWPWLPRLHALLGEVHLSSERRSGEADGFDGVTNHGVYDRLVAGEWALLELLPQEFVRRAVMNEQLYLKPAQKSPQEARRSLMLFHAGPDQLGAPRLVHMALLITMARRARASRTSFAWGILQNPPELWEGLSAESIASLLESRTWEAPEARHIDGWKDALQSIQPDDLWLVGSSGLTHLPRLQHASLIVVDQPFEIAATYLSVSAARHGNAPHIKLRLELPPPDAGVHLLRSSAYRKAALRSDETIVSAGIQLSWDGRRLFSLGADSSLTAYHIPNTSGERAGNTGRLHMDPSESLLAATLDWGHWSWLTLKEGTLRYHGPRTKYLRGKVGSGPIVAPPGDVCVRPFVPGCYFRVDETVRRGIAFTDGRQALVGLCDDKIVLYKERTSFCVEDTGSGIGLLFVENPSGDPRRLFHTVDGEVTDHPFDLHGDGTFQMVSRHRSVFGLNDAGCRWRFGERLSKKVAMEFDLQALPGSKVLGFMFADHQKTDPRLVCWTEGSSLVLTVSRREYVVLFNAFKTILSCIYHPGREILAMSTQDEMIVYSVKEGLELLRILRDKR